MAQLIWDDFKVLSSDVKVMVVDQSGGFGGSVRALQENLRHISEKNIQFTILHHLDDERFSLFDEYADRIQLTFLGRLTGGAWNSFLRLTNLGLVIDVLRTIWVCKKHSSDLIYTNNDLECNLSAIIAGAILRMPVICHERDTPSFHSKTTRLFYGVPQKVIAVSQAARQSLLELGVPNEKIHVILDGINLSLFEGLGGVSRDELREQRGLPLDAKIVMIAGMITDWKGQHLLAQAAPTVIKAHPDALFLIVGESPPNEGDYEQKVKNIIEENGTAESVRFLGFQENVHELMYMSDMVIHASTKPEPFGLVIVEAMAASRCILAADSGGPTEIITPGVDGDLFTTSDSDALAEKISFYLAEDETRAQMGMKARETAFHKFSSQRVAEDVYHELGNLLQAKEASPLNATGVPIKSHYDLTRLDIRQQQLAPLALEFLDKPNLFVMIDVEEEFDWNSPFTRTEWEYSSQDRLADLHAYFVSRSIKPCYMIDYPVVMDEAAANMFKEWAQRDECVIGAQLHVWLTPPFKETLTESNSFQCNLTPDVEEQKLKELTRAIKDNIGVSPQVFRAGRYGLGSHTVGLLQRYGYKVDASIMPSTSYGSEGGPNRVALSNKAFWWDDEKTLLEVPVSRGVVGALGERFKEKPFNVFDQELSQALHLPGILARSKMLERITLSPEGNSLSDGKRLVASLERAGEKIFCLSLHSSSLQVGGSPYAETEQDVEELLNWIKSMVDYLMGDRAYESPSILDFYNQLYEMDQPSDEGAMVQVSSV